MRIILASASPRRKELLSTIVKDFECLPQNVDEYITIQNPELYVKSLAERKMNNLDLKYKDDLIISADTIVYYNNKYYGKPKDHLDAVKILKELTGNTHFVYTGVCISLNGIRKTFVEESMVTFKKLDDAQINNYVATNSPMDKAGAYGIQDNNVVDYYSGSYTNIVGLPMEKLEQELKEMGVI